MNSKVIVDKINNYEKIFCQNHYFGNSKLNYDIEKINGKIPILVSAPHSVRHGEKFPDTYTGALARLLNDYTNCFTIYSVKSRDDFDLWNERYNKVIELLFNKYNIKAIIEIHGANINNPFDIDIGTHYGKTINSKYVKDIKAIFLDNNIKNVKENHTFCASERTITYQTYFNLNIPSVQIEINKRFRNSKVQGENSYLAFKSLVEIVNYLNDVL